MTEHLDFMNAIIAEPDEDSPRLIYADWLEEQGQAERSEFVRVQCELAKPCEKELSCGRLRSDSSYLCEYHSALHQREGELLEKNALDWFAQWEFDEAWGGIANIREGNGERWHGGWHDGKDGFIQANLERGFIGTVRVTLALWIGGECLKCNGTTRNSLGTGYGVIHCAFCVKGRLPGLGPAIIAAHPIARVVTEKRPEEAIAGSWRWYCDAGYSGNYPDAQLPEKLFWFMYPEGEHKPGEKRPRWFYDSEQQARDALSQALIRYAPERNTDG